MDPAPPRSDPRGNALSIVALAMSVALLLVVLWTRGDLTFGSAESRAVTPRGVMSGDREPAFRSARKLRGRSFWSTSLRWTLLIRTLWLKRGEVTPSG